MKGRIERASSWPARPVAVALVAVLLVAGCAGAGVAGTPGSTVAPTPTRSPAAGGGGQPQATTEGQGATEVIDFDVEGTIAGQQVAGKLTHTSFTVACNGAGPDQILAVHWIGTSPAGPGLNGSIDFKPGTWQVGSTSAQGNTDIGSIASKPADILVGVSGTVTTQPSGGTIDATYDQGTGQVTVKGTWSCPQG